MDSETRIGGRSADRCDFCAARRLGICGSAEPEAGRALAARSRLSLFTPGDAILAQGEPADRIGIIVSGQAKVVNATEDGAMQVLDLLGPGDLVGDPVGTENPVSWDAATELALCWLPRASLEPLLESHRSLSRGYLAATVARLQAQRHRAASLRGRSAVQRIAAWLAAQTPEIREAGAPVIRLRLSRRDLASLLDMSVETLCRGLHQVEERGAIRLLAPDVVMVMRPGRLCEVAGAPAECPADPDLARRG